MILALMLLLAASEDVALRARAIVAGGSFTGHAVAAPSEGTALQPGTGSAATLVAATLDGRRLDPFTPGARATVFVFIHPDCPVSSKYVPELNRMHDEYASRGIRLFVVYPGRDDDDAVIRAHYKEYALRVPALRDADYRLADLAGATLTPEAAVFVERTLVYRGRIDDRAPRLGVWRAAASSHDLSDVLARIAKGGRVTPRTTQAVGCYIKPIS